MTWEWTTNISKDNEGTAPGPDFTESYKLQLKYSIMCQCMPVEMVSFISGLLCHMLSVVWGTSCDIGMKHPSFLRDKKPTPPPPAFPSFSALYFCNWRCHNEINSVAITDFTSCYQFPLEEAATWRRLKIFLFHASSISSLYERWASGCVCCFRLMSLDRVASCLCLWHTAVLSTL